MAKPTKEQLTEGMRWMLGPHTGASSQSLLAVALGMEKVLEFGIYHPVDPSDLGRCLRLLRKCPWVRELAFPRLAALDEGWAKLVPQWDALAKAMEAEVGWNWRKGDSAPNTYARMRTILAAAA